MPWIILWSIAFAGPAAAEDGSPTETGRRLFADDCVACHGADATEGDGGDIRGVALGTLRRATRGIEAMPAFELSEADLIAVAAWLASL